MTEVSKRITLGLLSELIKQAEKVLDRELTQPEIECALHFGIAKVIHINNSFGNTKRKYRD